MEGLGHHKVVEFRMEKAEVCGSVREDGTRSDRCVKGTLSCVNELRTCG